MQPSTPEIDRAARRKAFEVAFANASPDDPTPILTAARLAKVPRPSAYRYAAKVAAQSERDEQKPLTPRQVELVAMITVEWERSHRISGAVKIHHEIRKTVRCGKNLIAKLMQRAGIKGAYNAPTVRRKRDVAPDSVDGQWHREDRKVIAADTMEFACADGRLFVAGNVDCDSRRTFAAISEKNDTRNTIASLKDAARNVQLDPGQSVTGLSDQGPQYTASPYTATLAEIGFDRANTPVHSPTKNTIVEGTWSLFRREFPRYVLHVKGKRIRQLSCREARTLMRDYVQWFNESRVHSALEYRSPTEFERLPRDERRAILARWDHDREIARDERRQEIERHNADRAARLLASLACAPVIARAPLALVA
jgi:putative transposase